MPELSRFYGIIIKMYFNDTQQHHKPHIHAFYGTTKQLWQLTETFSQAQFQQNN